MQVPKQHNLSRRAAVGLLALGLPLTSGCFSPWFSNGGQAPSESEVRRQRIKDTLRERPQLLTEIAYERSLTRTRLENVGIVTGLVGTGGTVKASQPRERMLSIMKRYGTKQPNTFLDNENTAMVVATVVAPPAAKRGMALDVAVQFSTHAEGTSLNRGWLMETDLMEMSQINGQVREGFKAAAGIGSIVTAAEATGSDDPEDQRRGTIVGGARLLKDRELGIAIEPEFADAITLASVLPAIGKRFTVFNGHKQTGIATPIEDNLMTLTTPTRYELDPYHFINVVLHLGINEPAEAQMARVETLALQLHEPVTVRQACWQLEAIGETSVPVLLQALQNPNPEVRFYAAHSLAYLDNPGSVAPLAELCRQEPAFRAMCLNGLSILDHFEAEDALRDLLHSADAEVRYGAVRALRYRDPRDPQISGTPVGETGRLLEIPSEGPPLVVISLHETPEVVIFGNNPILILPEFENITPRMMIQTEVDGRLTISHFEPGKDDRISQCTPDLRSVLLAISEVGGTYGNWVSFIRQSSQRGYMSEPLAINPIPTAGRTYQRDRLHDLEPGEGMLDGTIINTDFGRDGESQDGSAARTWYNPFTWL